LAEWFYEEGIGESRAILVENGRISEAAIEYPGGVRAGTIARGRLSAILVPGRRGIVTLDRGDEALVEPLPRAATEGAAICVEIVREALAEAGRPKLAKSRLAESAERDGPPLGERLPAHSRRTLAASEPDEFERAGWSELLEEAATGQIPFAGGTLRMSLTPAMTLFDVDGALAPAALAVAGAEAAAGAIRRFGIGGSIGIDLPTLDRRSERQAAAAAFDAALPAPFERTAVNGFGFLQVVRKRERPSLAEIVRSDLAGAAARALLRRAERAAGSGRVTLHAAPAVAAALERDAGWLKELARRLGRPVALRADPGLAIFAGHAHCEFPG